MKKRRDGGYFLVLFLFLRFFCLIVFVVFVVFVVSLDLVSLVWVEGFK